MHKVKLTARAKKELKFNPKKRDYNAMQFEFKRLDNNKAVLVSLYTHNIPFPENKSRRLGELFEKVIWEAAKEKEIKEFQDLWMEKVENIVLLKNEADRWLKIE